LNISVIDSYGFLATTGYESMEAWKVFSQRQEPKSVSYHLKTRKQWLAAHAGDDKCLV
jgi:hypothetical protein